MQREQAGPARTRDAAGRIRVFVVDDHPLLREGLKIRIESQTDMEWAGEAKNPEQALELMGRSPPDVAIVDLTLAGGGGFTLVEQLRTRAPAVRIVVFSASGRMSDVARSLELGASGYVCKQEDSSDILAAVRAVASNKPFLGRETARKYRRYRAAGDQRVNDIGSLSKREFEIFELVADGMSTSEIAEQLSLSPHTIGSHKENIRHKLGAASSTELVQRAVEWKLAGR